MRVKECVSCRELLPIERFPPLPQGGHCDQCDAPYCQALRHAALVAVHMAMIKTFWPLPLMAMVIIVLSIILSPWLWLSFIPLTAWTAWKLRTIQDRSIQTFRKLPAKLTDRVDRLGHLRALRAELVRANITVNARHRTIPLRGLGLSRPQCQRQTHHRRHKRHPDRTSGGRTGPTRARDFLKIAHRRHIHLWVTNPAMSAQT